MHRRTTQKDLHDPDNHYGVITHVKWALGSIATNKDIWR